MSKCVAVENGGWNTVPSRQSKANTKMSAIPVREPRLLNTRDFKYRNYLS